MNKFWSYIRFLLNPKNIRFFLNRNTFEKRRSEIYAQMAFALEHDANVRSELDEMVKIARVRKSQMLPIYLRWLGNYKGVAAGVLSQSMKETISNAECSLIASAEETQNLARGFRFLSQSTKKIAEMEKAIIGAVRSIFLPAAMLLGLLYSIDAYFFPIVLESVPKSDWGTIPTLVAGLAHNISSLIAIGTVAAPAIYLWWKHSLTRWTGKTRLLFERSFLYSKYRDFNCAVFLVNLAFLIEAGKPPRGALETIYKNSSPYLKWHIGNMIKRMDKSSSNMGHVLVSTGLFSEELGDLLTNYARWTDWHTQIGEIAYAALETVTRDVLEMSPRIQEGLKAVVGVVVFLVLATVGTIVMTIMQKSGFK